MRCRLHVASLEDWNEKILQLANQFTLLDNQHIFHDYNSQADDLSKKGLQLEEGTMFIEEYKDNEFISENLYNFF